MENLDIEITRLAFLGGLTRDSQDPDASQNAFANANSPCLSSSFAPEEFYDSSPEMETKTRRVLDALALVCVQQRSSEVFALTASIQPHNLTITIAGNQGVPLSTENHLIAIWEIMQRINSLARTVKPEASTFRHVSPEILKSDTPEPILEMERQLYRRIYQHSFPKFQHRLQKAIAMLDAIAGYMRQYHQENPQDQFATPFFDLDAALTCAFEDWPSADFFTGIGTALQYFLDHFTSDEGVSWVSNRENDFNREQQKNALQNNNNNYHSKKVVNLWRRLKKCLDLTSKAHVLYLFARSRRSYRLFEMGFHVVRLGGMTSPPLTIEEILNTDWEQVFIKGAGSDPAINFAGHKVLAKATSTRSCAFCVHCELQLLLHFTKEPLTPRSPIPYIGVSKLSCLPCYVILKAYNAIADPNHRLFVRGCSGNWYCGWLCPPTTTIIQAAPSACRRMGRKLKKYWAREGLTGNKEANSDSSAGQLPNSSPRPTPKKSITE